MAPHAGRHRGGRGTGPGLHALCVRFVAAARAAGAFLLATGLAFTASAPGAWAAHPDDAPVVSVSSTENTAFTVSVSRPTSVQDTGTLHLHQQVRIKATPEQSWGVREGSSESTNILSVRITRFTTNGVQQDVVSGTTYQYRVRYCHDNTYAVCGDWSSILEVTTTEPPPAAPAITDVRVTAEAVRHSGGVLLDRAGLPGPRPPATAAGRSPATTCNGTAPTPVCRRRS